MNEHQVAIGESTCASNLFAAPVSAGGKALLEVSELSQIGLERGRTAREVILIMGSLAEQYGYYSAEWDTGKYGEAYAMGEGGEALTVVDKDEAWMFHIIPDDTGASAIWVAQRVPDDHIAAVANSFVIREVIADHPDFLYSSNLWSVATKLGWYDPSKGENLNFLKTYSPQRYHPSYANYRVWRVFSVASSVDDQNKYPMNTNAYADDYPFSAPVTREAGPFNAHDLMKLQRDHYEGTPISTAEGLAGGPFGDPNRFDLWSNGDMTVWEANEGEFPRTISLFRTSYSFVAEPRQGLLGTYFPRMWLCQYAPDSSTYTPMYVTSKELPAAFTSGTMQKYNTESAFWNFCVVGNYAARFYSFAMKSVRELQARLDKEILWRVNMVETDLLHGIVTRVNTATANSVKIQSNSREESDKKQALEAITSALTELTVSLGQYVSQEWRDFFPVLLTTYRDGYVIGGQNDASVVINRMFYPKWWLEAVGFFQHPGNKDGILFAPSPTGTKNTFSITVDDEGLDGGMSNVFVFGLAVFLITAAIFFFLGMAVAHSQKRSRKHRYLQQRQERQRAVVNEQISLGLAYYQYQPVDTWHGEDEEEEEEKL